MSESGGRLDPAISTLARWADEDPEAMRRLISDPALQHQLLDTLATVEGPLVPGHEEKLAWLASRMGPP